MPTTISRRLLRSLPLHRRTDTALRAAVKADDLVAFQEAYVAAIAKPLKRLRKKTGNHDLLALWSEDSVELSGRERELAVSLDELSDPPAKVRGKKGTTSVAPSRYEETIANWLVESVGVPGPWETIAIAEILLREAHRLSPERFLEALAVLANGMLRQPVGGLFDGTSASDSGADDAIRQIIEHGESPWICSLLLSPLGGTQPLQTSAAEALQNVLTDGCDANGLVHGSMLRRLPQWLAPLTRCSIWADAFHQTLWNDNGAARLTAVTERAAALLLPVPQRVTNDTPESAELALSKILDLLLPLVGSVYERPLQKLLRQCKEPANEVTRPKKLKLKNESSDNESTQSREGKGGPREKPGRLTVSWQSDTSCMAILRSSMAADADLLTLDWHSSDAQLMLAAAGVPLLDGPWSWSVRIDDEVVPPPSAWKCSCWFLDPETVFLELEGEGSSPLKRVRQVLLAPHDRFAMLTDSVTSQDPDRKVTLVTSIPLVRGACCVTHPVTRELSLSSGPRTARTFPMWLEDDRIRHTHGSYREHDGQLELAGVGKGGVTLPLALDWHPKRDYSAADWARLTVTETRRIVGAHEASGFRIRVGDHQVLLYRSLMAGKNSRAVLGLHSWDESVYSRVSAKGGPLSPLVEVESPE